MTSGRMLRPVLVCLAALGAGLATASCGIVDSDPHRFEAMARTVADIPLDDATHAPVRTAAEEGLRPAQMSTRSGLKVEVMDPHDLWDARDAGLRGVIRQVGAAASPAVAQAVVQRVSAQVPDAVPMRPAIAPTAPSPRTTIQLGAYSSPEAARAAWSDVSAGSARDALKGLSPVFETVMVNGRPFTRLKVVAPAAAATALCRAAEVSDPWCARSA